ncbi:thioesterase II family protein [Streptomyces sp. NPDC091383]|uniref:thioesterase II family protein n=1 Tax=Streptomyces sp. NPDC091383 TaxID=3365996 RepID=UPI0038165DFD
MRRQREEGWLRRLVPCERPAVRLVCFPHSGGSAIAFEQWADALAPGVELLAVQYPGRGDRFGEELVCDVAELAGHVVRELVGLPMSEHVLFGHSLGALLAYESAVLLRDMGREPEQLCVSACLPPGHLEIRHLHQAPDDEFWDSLCALGGIDPAIAENEELREMLAPALRSDLRAHATYEPASDTKRLSCPVRCYHGIGDPIVEEEQLSGWAKVTTGAFALGVRPGGHFHLSTDPAVLVAEILDVQRGQGYGG